MSQGDASVLLRIGAIRNYVGAACQCVDGFEAVDSEKRHDTLRDNMFSRNKKTALVTGASSGMGKAIAKRLVEDGYQVYAAARHVERMDDLAQLGARPVRMDISSEAEVATAIDTILAEVGAVDVLVNNAGFGLYVLSRTSASSLAVMRQASDTVPEPSPRRARLVEIATGVFTRCGFKETSMDDVARAARLSSAGPYLHFASKTELFRGSLRHAHAERAPGGAR